MSLSFVPPVLFFPPAAFALAGGETPAFTPLTLLPYAVATALGTAVFFLLRALSARKAGNKPTDEMKSYIEQEKIINACLKLALSSGTQQEVSDAILKIIGEQLNADRCYIFHYADGTVSNTSEWCAPGIVPQKDNLQDVPDSCISRWTQAFKEHRVIRTDDLLHDTAVEFADSREILMAQGIQTLLITGIWTKNKLWGFVGIDFVKSVHKFTATDERMIQAASNIFELYLERTDAINTLKASEAQKSLILDSIQIPILMYDKRAKLIALNQKAVSIAGIPREEVLKMPCNTYFCGRKTIDENCPVRQCIRSKQPISYELAVAGREYLNSTSPILNSAGEVEYILSNSIDMTAHNRDKRSLVKAMEDAKAAYKAKSIFLATVSHEIRTPLNAVIGYSDLSQRADVSKEENLENLKNINIAANALLSLINDVLDLSKLESGQLKMEKTPADMETVLRDILSIFKYRVQKQGLKLSLNLAPDMPQPVVDIMRLKQVLINIIGNAVKFTDKGGVAVNVRFDKTSEKTGNLSFTIKDTGMGIAPEYIDKIFDPFERQPQHIAGGFNSFEGTGLGLPISQRLVKEMGGELSVTSVLKEGSEFSVIIPNLEYVSRSGQPAVNNSTPRPDLAGFAALKVLVVDDVEMNLKVMAAILKKLGITPVLSLSAKEALEEIRKSKPDIILTDIWMPNISGEEFAKLVREEPNGQGVPVIAVTADSQTLNFGDTFNDVILKPINMDKITELLNKFRIASSR